MSRELFCEINGLLGGGAEGKRTIGSLNIMISDTYSALVTPMYTADVTKIQGLRLQALTYRHVGVEERSRFLAAHFGEVKLHRPLALASTWPGNADNDDLRRKLTPVSNPTRRFDTPRQREARRH